MALFSAEVTTTMNDSRWCICRQCVYGFGISCDVDGGGEVRVCGELCVVGRPMALNDGIAAAAAVAKVTAATVAPTTPSPLRCNICRVEVELLSSKPLVSDDDSLSDN